jgi:hypothetical protein
MDGAVARQAGLLDAAVDIARRQPGRMLTAILAAHLVIWTLLPIALSPNLQLDLAEGLALGREWQLGYWKHPPLPWWVTDLIYRVTGTIYSVYALGPLAVVICLLGVYFLARDMVGPVRALIPVLALEGIHYYNFSAVKFAHDQMQLPIWAWAAFFFYRALVRGNAVYWMAAGALVALAFWAKYAAVIFGLTLALFLVLDPVARRSWSTPGPYLMALAFGVVIAPHLAWLIAHHEIGPFTYVETRARQAAHWYQFLTFPLRWIGGQLLFVLPALGLLALVYPRWWRQPIAGDQSAFVRRFAATLALGPFAIVAVLSALTGRLPVLMWGYPLWTFLPLGIIAWFGGATETVRQRAFAAGFAVVFVTMPVLYAAVPFVESLLRDRTLAVHYPGRAVGEHLTRIWREKTDTPLSYVAGEEFSANNVAVYSSDRPRVIVHGIPERAPWIDMRDVHRKGVLVVWTDQTGAGWLLHNWEHVFGFKRTESAVLELPMQSRRPKTIRLRYAIVPPRP